LIWCRLLPAVAQIIVVDVSERDRISAKHCRPARGKGLNASRKLKLAPRSWRSATIFGRSCLQQLGTRAKGNRALYGCRSGGFLPDIIIIITTRPQCVVAPRTKLAST